MLVAIEVDAEQAVSFSVVQSAGHEARRIAGQADTAGRFKPPTFVREQAIEQCGSDCQQSKRFLDVTCALSDAGFGEDALFERPQLASSFDPVHFYRATGLGLRRRRGQRLDLTVSEGSPRGFGHVGICGITCCTAGESCADLKSPKAREHRGTPQLDAPCP